jgi:hypothetical protein
MFTIKIDTSLEKRKYHSNNRKFEEKVASHLSNVESDYISSAASNPSFAKGD